MSISLTDSNSNLFEPISIKMYSDTTPMVKSIGWARFGKADTITVTGGSLSQFMTAMFLVDAVREDNPLALKRLVLPYVPGARQDRINPTGDVLFTAKSVAREINARGFDEVVVLDPHSPVVTEHIDNVKVYPLANVADKFERTYDGVIAADKGGKTRAEELAHAKVLPVFYGGKTRDVATGKLTGFTMEDLPQGHYLVADDICDGGGTFLGLAEKIAEQGATADLYVSHGIFSKGTRELEKAFGTIYTTDSLDLTRDVSDVRFIPVVRDMQHYG